MRNVLFSAAVALLFPMAVIGQTTTRTLVADMTPSAENPPVVDTDASGHAAVAIHMVRDANGELTSAIVDFRIMWAFGQDEILAAMHIHRGAAGSNGPVVIDSGFMGPVAVSAGTGTFLQSTGEITDAAMLDTLEAVLANPAGYYVNLHSVSNPPGLIRGQLGNSERYMIMTANGKLDALSEDQAATAAEVNRIGATLDALARRAGVVPASN